MDSTEEIKVLPIKKKNVNVIDGEENEVKNVNILKEMANYTFVSKYARYNEKLKRRETWEEAVDRVYEMHYNKFRHLVSEKDWEDIKWAFSLVKEKRVVPSMRSMQFGGEAVFAHNSRIFNCAVRHVDSIRAFAEIMYLLLSGCGVGIGLSKTFLSRLPNLVDADDKNGTVLTYVVQDNIEGWADSIEALLNCYFKNTAYSGRKIIFDYSRIRRKGSKLKIGGGKAPGYLPLKNCHSKIKKLLDTIIEKDGQTRIKSINCYDILMHCADAVLAGGVRRSATCVIFEQDDVEMLNAKTGNWLDENPQRGRSNNSVRLIRNRTTLEDFKSILQRTKEFGEPGFVFANHEYELFNPCFEISFIPVLEDGTCGVQFCNLSSMNGAKIKSKEDLLECTIAATILGTLQATYTDFKYLSPACKTLTESEALLGVSITGIMDNPDILLNAKYQKEAAKLSVETNKKWAKILGINQAARVTCIKPEGTTSIVLECASGIHPHHAHKYIRRIQASKIDNVYRYFKSFNGHTTEESVWSSNKTDDVIAFPLNIPKTSIVKEDLDAIKHLEIVRSTQKNWVHNGITEINKKPISHNVSCTVIVDNTEWDIVSEYIFKYRNDFAALSFLPKTGDKDFKQAPNEKVETKNDEKFFNNLLQNFSLIDYKNLVEEKDETHLQQEMSCYGGQCEVI